MLRAGRQARGRNGRSTRAGAGKTARSSVPARSPRAAAARPIPLSEGQSQVLELIATGAPLKEILESLVRLIEANAPGVLGSILLLDEDGRHMRGGAAPSLPAAFNQAIDGAVIGPRAGSCGTAAWRKERVVVEDIERDPLWTHYRTLAKPHGLRACWSTPIFDAAGQVLGTFAMYCRRTCRPTARHLKMIDLVTHTAAIAITSARVERERTRLTHDLGERIKELEVLHRASRLLQFGRPIDESLFLELACLLPPAWRHSEICEARIAYGGREARTPGWRDSPWKQSAGFATGDGRSGSIEVAYREERPVAEDGPFLAEERRLIRSLAEMLVSHLERGRVEQARRESEAMFRSVFESAAIGITMVDMDQRIIRCNRAFAELLGYAEEALRGHSFSEFTHPEDVHANEDLYRSLRAGEIDHFELEKRYLHKDGSLVWARVASSLVSPEGASMPFTIGMIEDITARREAEERIRHLAYHDPLTALPNRAALLSSLSRAVEEARARGGALALLLLNINGFHNINDALGHENGDVLLRQVAVNLRDTLWESDMVACLGADEYGILLARLASRNDIDLVLAKITDSIRRPVNIAGIPVNLDASIGIALYPEHGETAGLLWQRADIGLRAARERQQSYVFYSPSSDHYDPKRLALLGELRGAIYRNELVLHYQPKIDLKTERVVAVEALVRWQHSVHGMIYPDRFVPMAERTHLIDPLTTWVLANALRQGQLWRGAGLFLELSVNLSARNLHNPNLITEILDLARGSRFPLEQLTVEITESAIMADPTLAKSMLAELHAAGIHFSMDDFGIGQSSLAYLKDLPISKMKIDKSFVMGCREPRNAAIVRSAIELGHNLALQVTAEGVEDEHALRELQRFDCDLGQGYYFAKPMPADQITAWLRESRWKCG